VSWGGCRGGGVVRRGGQKNIRCGGKKVLSKFTQGLEGSLRSFVQLLAAGNQAAQNNMKRMILAGILLIGGGVASSQAGTYGSAYVRQDCAPAAYNSGYSRAYPQSYYYQDHDALHNQMGYERRNLHETIKAERRAAERDLREQREHGAPEWQVKAQRRALNESLKQQHRQGHELIKDQHRAAEYALRW